MQMIKKLISYKTTQTKLKYLYYFKSYHVFSKPTWKLIFLPKL